MEVQTLKDMVLNGQSVKAGAIVRVGRAQAAKLVREGLAKLREDPKERLETK